MKKNLSRSDFVSDSSDLEINEKNLEIQHFNKGSNLEKLSTKKLNYVSVSSCVPQTDKRTEYIAVDSDDSSDDEVIEIGLMDRILQRQNIAINNNNLRNTNQLDTNIFQLSVSRPSHINLPGNDCSSVKNFQQSTATKQCLGNERVILPMSTTVPSQFLESDEDLPDLSAVITVYCLSFQANYLNYQGENKTKKFIIIFTCMLQISF